MTEVQSDSAPFAAALDQTEDRTFGIGDLRQHAARGVLVNGAYQVGLIVLSAVKGLVAAAFLTRSDYGVWGLLALALWTAVGLKQQFGANDKYIQQSGGDQELAFQRAFTVEVLFATVMVPVVMGVVVAFMLLSGDSAVLAPGVVLLALLPATVLQFPLWAFYRQMDYRRQRTLQAIDPVSSTVITLTMAALGAGYWSLVLGVVGGAWAGAFVALRASPYRIALRFDRRTLREYVGFSAPLVLAGLAGLATFQVIFLVGSGPLGLAGLGAFTLVGNLVQYTDQADAIVTETLYPAICAARDRTQVLAEAFVKSNRLALMWAVPFGVGLTLFAPELVQFIIGRRWSPAIPLMRVMGLVTAANHVGFNWYAFFKAQGKTWPFALVAGTSSVIVIALGIPFMFEFGLIGIGYAYVASCVVALCLRAVLLTRFFGEFALITHLGRAFAPTLPAAGSVLALRALGVTGYSLPAALGMFALYALVVVVATGALERPLLREAIGYVLRKRSASAENPPQPSIELKANS